MYKDILILANSIKHGGKCIAGRDINTDEWFRIVSTADGDQIPSNIAKYNNCYGTQNLYPLKVIRVHYTSTVPLPAQPENILNDTTHIWEQVDPYRKDISELNDFLEYPADLWGTGNSINDADVMSGAININQSLYLVKVEQLELLRVVEEEKTRRRAKFVYNGVEYYFPVTDPSFDRIYNGESPQHSILCISLGENFSANNRHYKIVAGIF